MEEDILTLIYKVTKNDVQIRGTVHPDPKLRVSFQILPK